MNVILTEEQSYILETLVEINLSLNEGRIDEASIGKLFKKFFKNCKNFKDCARVVLILVGSGYLAGAISVAALIKSLPFGTEQEKQELLSKTQSVGDTKSNSTQSSQTYNASNHLEAAFKADGWNSMPVVAKDWKMSEQGKTLLKRMECGGDTPILELYYATKGERLMGKKTIGWGHVVKKNENPEIAKILKGKTRITRAEADRIFEIDLLAFEKLTKKKFQSLGALSHASCYPQGFVDAMISIMYNMGPKHYANTPVFEQLRKSSYNQQTHMIKKGDYTMVCAAIKKTAITQTVNGRPQVLKGLQNRRNNEYQMAWAGNYEKIY